jgi:LuxR family maltose regulon positive regulatory protein
MSTAFSERLRAGRLALGLTQAALAEQAGCSAEMLRKFEAGAKRPSLAVAERLAERIGLAEQERAAFLAAAGGGRPAAIPGPASPAMPWFPRTKLQPPRQRGDLLNRRRLLDPLRAAVARSRVILVAAPAGAGKTTLLASLIEGRLSPALSMAWVALDSDDNDLARLLSVLLAAFGQLAPVASTAAADLAVALGAQDGDRTAQVRHAVAVLINALLEAPPTPGLLVLDDLHVLSEPAVFTALEYLIDQLPAHLTLAIATRHDPPLPLARLRARRELLEIRLPELRFTAAETADLLRDCFELPLSPIEVGDLHRRTEGWAAGLSLLAASVVTLETPAERTSFLAQLTQTDRYLFEYLAEEVLDRQDPFVRTFLLETAVLAELTPQACQLLTGRDDAPQVLDELYRRNLFLVKLVADPVMGADQATYRYHDLFRAFLLERLRRGAPEWLRGLHRRAAGASSDRVRAIEHLLMAELWEDAAAGAEAIGEELLARGAHHTLQGLIEGLPEPTRAARPRLRYLLGACALMRWEHRVAAGLLDGAAADFGQAGDMMGQSETLVLLASVLSQEGALQQAAAVTERALLLPLTPARRVQLLAGRAWQQLAKGAWPQAVADLDEALAIAERANEALALRAFAGALTGALIGLPGALARVERLGKLAAGRTRPEERSLLAAVRAMQAWGAIWQDRWEAAIAEAQGGLDLCADSDVYSTTHSELLLVQAVSLALSGAHGQSDASFEALEDTLLHQAAQLPAGRMAIHHQVARVRWLQGRGEELRAIHRLMVERTGTAATRLDSALVREVGALVQLAADNPGGAARELRSVAEDQTRVALAPTLGDPRLHLAYAQLLAGNGAEALATAGPAIAVIRREGAPGRLRWQGLAVIRPVLELCAAGGPHAEYAAAALARLA